MSYPSNVSGPALSSQSDQQESGHSRRSGSFPLHISPNPQGCSGNDQSTLIQHLRGDRQTTQSTATLGPDSSGVPDRRTQRRFNPYHNPRQSTIGLSAPESDLHDTNIVSEGSHKAEHWASSSTPVSEPLSNYGFPGTTADPSLARLPDVIDSQLVPLYSSLGASSTSSGPPAAAGNTLSGRIPKSEGNTRWPLAFSPSALLAELQAQKAQAQQGDKGKSRSSPSGGDVEPHTREPLQQPPGLHSSFSIFHRTPDALQLPSGHSAALPQSSRLSNYSRVSMLERGSLRGVGGQVPNILPSPSELNEGGSHANQLGSGFFPYAQDFTMHQPTFVEMMMPPATSRLEGALGWLGEYTMEGAQFNSQERVPVPRCHPRTRTSIITHTTEWIQNPEREKRLLWLRGPAGVGKSAIIQTLAENLSTSRRLGASLFFSRQRRCSNPQQVFPTIAYQLAIQEESYKEYINGLMLREPQVLKTAMEEQFRVLIVVPFTERMLRSGLNDLLVAVDGLDECDGDPATSDLNQTFQSGRTLEEAHRDIVRLISNFVQQYPFVPLVWIIASRPEVHLKAVFEENSVKYSFLEEDIPVDNEEACQDVETFLAASFENIRLHYPDHFRHKPSWPRNNDFLEIAKASLGLFLFAHVVIRFIDDHNAWNPVGQLDLVLSAIAKLNLSQPRTNPLEPLDAIYTTILDRIPDSVLATTKQLLQILMYFQRYEADISEFTFGNMCKYLLVSHEEAIAAVRHLHSVVFFPKVYDIVDTRPRFYHASFGDYLEDPSRSGKYALDEWEFHPDRLLQVFLPQPSPSGNADDKIVYYTKSSYNLLARILESKELPSLSGLSIDLVGTRCLISEEQLELLFEHFDPSELLHTHNGLELMNEKIQLHEDCVWTDELKRRGYLSIETLDSISKPPVRFHVSGYATATFCTAFDFQRRYTGADIDLPFLCGQFSRLYFEEPKTKILLWGRQAGRQCAMIRKEDLPDWWRNGHRGTVYICGFSNA